jgi:hypothetical protein
MEILLTIQIYFPREVFPAVSCISLSDLLFCILFVDYFSIADELMKEAPADVSPRRCSRLSSSVRRLIVSAH